MFAPESYGNQRDVIAGARFMWRFVGCVDAQQAEIADCVSTAMIRPHGVSKRHGDAGLATHLMDVHQVKTNHE